MNKLEQVMEKIAADERTYPISRGLMTASNISELSIPGRVYRRAAQGRKNLGKEGITGSEKELLSKMKKEKGSKTYPISRAYTDPAVMGSAVAAVNIPASLLYTKGLGTRGKLIGAGIGALYGAAVGVGGAYLGRHVYSRSQLGRSRIGNEGWTVKDKELMKQLRKKALLKV